MKFYTSAVQRGNNILVRGYENGRAFSRSVKYQPTLFVPGKAASSWSSLYGEHLEPMQFDSINDAKDFLKRYENVKNFKIHGMDRFIYPFLNEEYPGTIEYDKSLIKIYNIDIEVASENGFPDPEQVDEEITVVTFKKGGMFHVFGLGKFETTRSDVKYFRAKDEKELLTAFVHDWSRDYPDIVTGWNIGFFDIIYLVNRISRVLGEDWAKKLSPWGFYNTRTVTIMGQEKTSISLAGIATLDYFEMYKKYTYTQQESYKLGAIAAVELDTTKIDYSEYETLHQLYKKDFQRYVEYNIRDVELVDKLDEKMKLIDLVLELGYDAKVNFIDTFTQVRMWDVIIHNHLWTKKVAIPTDFSPSAKSESYEGAYVKEPISGRHEWIVSFDLNSLYPSLIQQYNISPETIVSKEILLREIEKEKRKRGLL